MKKPNLFIAGLPRTGTSSLHSYLNQHPQIFMSPIKEPNYFARDFHIESDQFHKKQFYFPYRTEDRYLKLFKNWRNEKLAGEASWTNLYSLSAAEGIYQFNKKAKIIITIREPVEFLHSYHSAACFALGETIDDFEKALAIEKERKNGKFLSKRVIVPSWLYYSNFIKYSEQINRYLSFFDKDQICIIIFDELKKDTPKIYREVLGFLDLDEDFTPQFNIVNPNKILKWPRLKRYTLDSPYFRKALRLVFTDQMYAKMKNVYKDKIVTYGSREPLGEEIKTELKAKFKNDIDRLCELLKVDFIKLWNYE